LWFSARLIRRSLCWFPGLFWAVDFTGPGVAIKRGRRQEPRTTAGSSLPADCLVCGFVAPLTPSSFGSRFGKEKTAKLLPRSTIGPAFQHPLRRTELLAQTAERQRSQRQLEQRSR